VKRIVFPALLVLLASPATSGTWTCLVPYDEVNGGGRVTMEAERLVFVSNWPHRAPESMTCTRIGLMSECMSMDLSLTGAGGASVFAKLYSVLWHRDGAPATITTRQPSAIFKQDGDGYAMTAVFPAIVYTVPVTDCKAE